ncbi:hypothetical protein GJ496_003365 [Pomphorhynchus laevis]|nr:hypothetical protein GJ496_003365 [Pomphorhynchus laevis]
MSDSKANQMRQFCTTNIHSRISKLSCRNRNNLEYYHMNNMYTTATLSELYKGFEDKEENDSQPLNC